MPHIKSIRLVNVHFNNATQFYDDFMLELNGYNTTYDLENGGGKSLLLLMILQTVLPKTSLRREKPISLIFQGGKDRTSHVAVEWILEEGSGYKYLLTGFSARKRKGSAEQSGKEAPDEEETLQTGDVEHLNWCVFYSDHKATGIKASPLAVSDSGKKAYASFEDIRRYIQQMKQKGLPAEIFDKIEQYQHFIATHSLIAAEWNIIRGINSGENNIESYFRQNATSRKLIENLFVKIVEDMEALNRGDKSHNENLLLADTLIEIRVKLNEYLKHKGNMAEFEKIKEYFLEFGRRNEELLQAFGAYETYRQQARAVRHFLGSKMVELEQDRTEALTKLRFNVKSRDEGQDLHKLLEAGLVTWQKEGHELVRRQWEQDREQLADRQAKLEDEWNRLRSWEDYGDYRAEKEQLQAIQKRLETLARDREGLQTDYQMAGSHLRFLLEKQFAEHEAMYDRTLQARKDLATAQKDKQHEIIELTRQETERKSAFDKFKQDETKLMASQKELNGFFLRRGETDALLCAEQALQELEAQSQGYEQESIAINQEIEMIDSRVRSLEQQELKLEGEVGTRIAVKREHELWLAKYEQAKNAMHEKMARFGKSTLAEYRQELENLLSNSRLEKLEQEIEAGRLQQKKQLSESRDYYVPNEEILAMAGKLNVKCEYVQAGIDWIASTSTAEKAQLLQRLPYLPFSVVVDRLSFEKLKAGRLKLDIASDYPVPIVNLDTIRQPEVAASDGVYYLCSFAELVLDSQKYRQYIQTVDELLIKTRHQMEEIDETVRTIGNDLLEVSNFYAIYPPDQIESVRNQIKTSVSEIEALNTQRQAINEGISSASKKRKSLVDRLSELLILVGECQEKIVKLTAVMEVEKNLISTRQQLSAAQHALAEVSEKITANRKVAEELEQRHQAVEGEFETVIIARTGIQEEKKLVDGFAVLANTLPLTHVRAEFKALKEAVSGQIAEETDLQRQAGEHERRMNTLKYKSKRDCGGDLEAIEVSERNGALIIIPSQAQITAAAGAAQDNAKQLKAAETAIQVQNLAIEKLAGKLTEIVKALPSDSVGPFPRYNSEEQYQQEMETAGQLIASYEQAVAQVNEELKRLNDTIGRLANQAELYDAFIEREGVPHGEGVAAEAKDFRVFEKEYVHLRDNVASQCSKWDNRLTMIGGETAEFVMGESLAELRKIGKPVSAEQCLGRQKAFAEYVANIEEQIRKIGNDILQLESYQQDFTRRCMQRAELVLGHLQKLQALSKIEVYGRRINMIELRLPEFEETEKALRMKSHIHAIIRDIGEEGSIDRKSIVARLSVKELLAQIVNMDKAAVHLYKIESIPENSRFYRWENAIGSEGQNNSLYFVFAACLISFIRMLSITHTAVRTKKVIIADNPFGATSAVYLWEPMFKILQQNDVQLIAPGHRIPREITSRFGVSYLLNQDILDDGRRRVVVKDVRVEEDAAVLRYIEPEQLTFF